MESTESKVEEVFNKHFVNIAGSIDITNIHVQEPLNDHVDDTSLAIMECFGAHPSILKMKSSVNSTIKFHLERSQ